MKNLTTSVNGPKAAYLLPIGDIHLGSTSCTKVGKTKLKGYLEWAREHEDEARIFLMGDLWDVATRQSKTSPFDYSSDEYTEAIDIFEPYKDLIIGSIDGNHEKRLIDFAGFSPNAMFCKNLGIPYCKWSALIKVRVGKRADRKKSHRATDYRNTYYVYAHHSRGGGGSLGNALNQAVKKRHLVEGCDVYLVGHNHTMSSGSEEVMTTSGKMRRVTYVCCGAYLSWDNSYAEELGYPPSKLGSPRVRLSGTDKHDVHVSL